MWPSPAPPVALGFIETGNRGWDAAEVGWVGLRNVTHVYRILDAVEIHGGNRRHDLDVIPHHNRTPAEQGHGRGLIGWHAHMPTEVVVEKHALESPPQLVGHDQLSDFDQRRASRSNKLIIRHLGTKPH